MSPATNVATCSASGARRSWGSSARRARTASARACAISTDEGGRPRSRRAAPTVSLTNVSTSGVAGTSGISVRARGRWPRGNFGRGMCSSAPAASRKALRPASPFRLTSASASPGAARSTCESATQPETLSNQTTAVSPMTEAGTASAATPVGAPWRSPFQYRRRVPVGCASLKASASLVGFPLRRGRLRVRKPLSYLLMDGPLPSVVGNGVPRATTATVRSRRVRRRPRAVRPSPRRAATPAPSPRRRAASRDSTGA